MDEVQGWLRTVGLDQYTPNFAAAGFDELDLLSNLTDGEFEELVRATELLPGHAIKLKRRLKSHPPTVLVASRPLAAGGAGAFGSAKVTTTAERLPRVAGECNSLKQCHLQHKTGDRPPTCVVSL